MTEGGSPDSCHRIFDEGEINAEGEHQMLITPFASEAKAQTQNEDEVTAIRRPSAANRQAIVSVALIIAAIVAIFVALSTVTPVAFAALGFLPLIQYRLMAQLSAD